MFELDTQGGLGNSHAPLKPAFQHGVALPPCLVTASDVCVAVLLQVFWHWKLQGFLAFHQPPVEGLRLMSSLCMRRAQAICQRVPMGDGNCCLYWLHSVAYAACVHGHGLHMALPRLGRWPTRTACLLYRVQLKSWL